MTETAREILLRRAKEYDKYLQEKSLIKEIAAQATPTQGGYLVPAELIERLKATGLDEGSNG